MIKKNLLSLSKKQKTKPKNNSCIIIGSVALSITEYNGHFRQGEQHVALWPKIAANPADSVLSNPDPKAMKLSLEVKRGGVVGGVEE